MLRNGKPFDSKAQILLLIAGIVLGMTIIVSAAPMVTETDSTNRDLQELEALFSGAGGTSDIYDMPNDTSYVGRGSDVDSLVPPYMGLFNNNSLFMDFNRLFGMDASVPYINFSSNVTPLPKIRRVIS